MSLRVLFVINLEPVYLQYPQTFVRGAYVSNIYCCAAHASHKRQMFFFYVSLSAMDNSSFIQLIQPPVWLLPSIFPVVGYIFFHLQRHMKEMEDDRRDELFKINKVNMWLPHRWWFFRHFILHASPCSIARDII